MHIIFFPIDIADKLLQHAKVQPSLNKDSILVADFDHLPFQAQSFDIVFSNMALQWSLHLNLTLHEISRVLKKQAVLAFSVPLPETLSELKPYSLNHFMPAEHIGHILQQHSYVIKSLDMQAYTISFPSLLQALQYIKKIGANYVMQRTNKPACISKQQLLKDTMINLTFKIGFFVAIKQ